MQVNDTFGASASPGAASTLGGHTTTLSLVAKPKRTPSAVMLMEDLKEGQRVIGWRLELSDAVSCCCGLLGVGAAALSQASRARAGARTHETTAGKYTDE